MAAELTDRQREILKFIADHTRDAGYPPTVREVGEEFGISSTNGVKDHLRALERKGVLRCDPEKARALVITAAGEAQLSTTTTSKEKAHAR